MLSEKDSAAGVDDDHTPTYVIQTDQLAKTYRGVTALKSLNLRVPKHAICGFLGPNGSGKSTALKLLLGLARPTSGSGTIFGYDIERESLAIRQRVGYLAQDQRFYESMTARETLRFTAHFFYTGPHAAIEERVAFMLDLVGLGEKADRPVKGFSGGERQRLGIAQAQINYSRSCRVALESMRERWNNASFARAPVYLSHHCASRVAPASGAGRGSARARSCRDR